MQFMHTLFIYDKELRWGIQGYSLCSLDNLLKGCNCSHSGVNVRMHLLRKNFSWTLVGFEVGQYHSNYASNNRGMINKVIKLKLQCFYTCLCTSYMSKGPRSKCGSRGGDRGSGPPLEKSQIIWVPTEISFWTSVEKVGPPWKMLDPLLILRKYSFLCFKTTGCPL